MNKNKNDSGQSLGGSAVFAKKVSELHKLLSRKPAAFEVRTNKKDNGGKQKKSQYRDRWAKWIKQVKLSFESLELTARKESPIKPRSGISPMSVELTRVRRLMLVADMVQQSSIRGLLCNPSGLYFEAAQIFERYLNTDDQCFNEAAHAYLEMGSNCSLTRSDKRATAYIQRAIVLCESAPQIDKVQLAKAHAQLVLAAPTTFFTGIDDLLPFQSALDKAAALWKSLQPHQANEVAPVLRNAIVYLHNRYEQAGRNFGQPKQDGPELRNCLQLLFQMHARQAEIKTLAKNLLKLKAMRFANDAQRQTYIESLCLALAYQFSLPQTKELPGGAVYLAGRVPFMMHQGSIGQALRMAVRLSSMPETGDNTSVPKIDSVVLKRGQMDIYYKSKSKTALSGNPMRLDGDIPQSTAPNQSGKARQIAKQPQLTTNRKARSRARRAQKRSTK